MFPTRIAIAQWLPGRRHKHKLLRKVLIISGVLTFALITAMVWCVHRLNISIKDID